ncbi:MULTISPECIES: HDOD domain-containing protein [unclassified Nitratiruptor]|uniref:HDOD domain-containing protein n=1 Tax=unclassified Nitratiruptor TaxID=2624044 RepID=UPI0019156897|nr:MULTISPECIES: HDOD domain-containing protein [unclassified Nitratiruptor]BCD60111.1 hypothetical protein NitYY0810_C0876 [Nitratiruptor sp. YY08-10]BCD64400.1 hypothetical protein NitYY0814_C1245 [Nitratiruptor sp. YY08-14]
MGLFGFGKKKKEQVAVSETNEIEHIAINHRKENRYIAKSGTTCNYGEVVDFSKKSLAVAVTKGSHETGESLQLELEGISIDAKVLRVAPKKMALKLENDLAESVAKRIKTKLKESEIEPKSLLDFQNMEHDPDMEKKRAIINLMLELEDPNTSVEKFKDSIHAIPEIRDHLIAQANSLENSRLGEVKDEGGAVTRLGFDRVKAIVYDYIMQESTKADESLSHFKDFDIYKIVLGAYFKKFAPLFGFKDRNNEAIHFLSTLNIGAEYLAKQSGRLAELYKSPYELFSFEMRFMEYREFGTDLFEINKYYFVDSLNIFRYIYDGFVLANMMLYPKYTPHYTIELSERKMRFGFIVYLCILALRFILSKDKYSGVIFYNRLKRLGYDAVSAKEFINETNALINQQLIRLGIDKKIQQPDLGSGYAFSLENYIGSGIYYEYVHRMLVLFDDKATRMALRFEDEYYTMDVLEKVLNFDEFGFKNSAFVIVPCSALADDEVPMDQFKAFNLVVFKDVDKLPKKLQKDFLKIWKDYEDKIICTFSSDSMIEYENKELFEALQPYIVDFPSYYQSPLLYTKMLTNTAQQINKFLGTSACDIALFKNDYVTQKSVYVECLK